MLLGSPTTRALFIICAILSGRGALPAGGLLFRRLDGRPAAGGGFFISSSVLEGRYRATADDEGCDMKKQVDRL